MVFEGDLLKDYRLDFKDNKLVRVELPSVEERKVGEWCKQNDDYFDWYECSECGYGSEGEMQYSSEYDVRTKYCPNCGCRMRGNTKRKGKPIEGNNESYNCENWIP